MRRCWGTTPLSHTEEATDTRNTSGATGKAKHQAAPARRASAGPAAVPVGGGGAWPDNESTRRAEGSRRGRLAGGSPPTGTHSDQAPLVWRAPEGPEGTGGLRDRPLRAFRLACGDLAGGRARRRPEHPWGHKQHKQEGRRTPAHTAAGPSDARNTSGTTQRRGAGPQARAPSATTQTRTLRSRCVPCRSARAARRSRQSSRSPRPRRRAGPRR